MSSGADVFDATAARSLAVAFLATLVATPPVRTAARRLHLLDHPNERSSHRTITPRSGGIGILLGMTVALAILPTATWGRGAAVLAAGGLLVLLVGVLDDRFGLPPWPRLAVHTLVALAVVGTAGGLDRLPLPPPLDLRLGPFGGGVAVLWVVAVVNFLNFMDGIDGLAGLQGLITAGALSVALAAGDPVPAAIAAALAGACGAFLLFNWSPASVFLGDAGSGLVGYTLATLPFLVTGDERPGLVLFVGASLFLLLADATTCLLRRVARGRRWYEAHREHLYQRWVQTGVGHGTVTSWLGVGALTSTVAALAGWRTGEAAWGWAALALGAAATAGEWLLVGSRERRVGEG